MNAITVVEVATPTMHDTWLDEGRNLLTQRQEIDWRLGDWMAEGKTAGYLVQDGFEFLSGHLGVAPKRLKDALKAAVNFPPSLRDTSLSIEHHAALANLPRDEALPLLKQASVEHLKPQQLREAVAQYRFNTGQNWTDEDTATTLATLIRRAWNRATPEARQMAYEDFEIAAAHGFGIIDEDETR